MDEQENTLAALAAYWRAHPDLRLAQVMTKALRAHRNWLSAQPEYAKWLLSDDDYPVPFSEMDSVAHGLLLLTAEEAT